MEAVGCCLSFKWLLETPNAPSESVCIPRRRVFAPSRLVDASEGKLNLQLIFLLRHIPDCLSCQGWLAALALALDHSSLTEVAAKRTKIEAGAPGRDSGESCGLSEKCCSARTYALNPRHTEVIKKWHEGGSGQVSAFSCRACTPPSFREANRFLVAKW